MSQEPDTVLRNSLDAVDRFRTRATVGIVVLFVAIVATILSAFATRPRIRSGK